MMTVSLPSVPGVTVSLPTIASSQTASSPVTVSTIQPGQSLLTANRVQPGTPVTTASLMA